MKEEKEKGCGSAPGRTVTLKKAKTAATPASRKDARKRKRSTVELAEAKQDTRGESKTSRTPSDLNGDDATLSHHGKDATLTGQDDPQRSRTAVATLVNREDRIGAQKRKFHTVDKTTPKNLDDESVAPGNKSGSIETVTEESRAGGGKRARAKSQVRDAQVCNEHDHGHINFVNVARLKAKEKSLLQAQILGFMRNDKLIKLKGCMEKFDYQGGLQNPSFLALMRAGFPKKTQKNLRHDTHGMERTYEPCEHLCVDAFELSIETIHRSKYVYLFTDAKCSKKRWAMLARAKAHYPRVLLRLLGHVRALGWEVKCLRTDGAGELVGEPARQIMDHHGIALEESSPHRPEENGSSERSVRAITDKARALMLNAPHLPASCEGLAVLHASALLELQPFEIDA